MRMGGAKDRIELRLIANRDLDQAEAQKELAAQLACFDAAKAQFMLTICPKLPQMASRAISRP